MEFQGRKLSIDSAWLALAALMPTGPVVCVRKPQPGLCLCHSALCRSICLSIQYALGPISTNQMFTETAPPYGFGVIEASGVGRGCGGLSTLFLSFKIARALILASHLFTLIMQKAFGGKVKRFGMLFLQF